MKSVILALAIAIGAVPTIAGEGTVDYLKARSNGANVILEWKTSSENDVVRFEIERAGQDGIFRYVATVAAKGSASTYDYTDQEAFSKPDGGAITSTYFTYRLRIVRSNKPAEYSVSAGVNHSVSSIKRTWGMIKEMFR